MAESETPIVQLDEHDTAAVVAILIRAARAGDQIKEDNEIVEKANVRLAKNNAILNKTINALALFGFEEQGEENVWNQVARAIGKDAYLRALAVARGREPGGGLLEQMGDEELPDKRPKQDFGHPAAQRPVAVRDAILRHLRSVGERGTNVGEIKKHLIDAYGMSVHEKTPGMTLYRLVKDGLARRDGRTWFATEETHEDEFEDKTGADLA